MNFFIQRPIFAMSIALVMILAGAVAMLVLPIAQYPPLVPPQVQVTTQYIGAGADVVAGTVTTPLEEKINGAAGMIYMSSTSTNNGDSAITATFDVGFDQDIGQMELLTRSNQALSELPPEVNQVGLTIQKHSSNMLLAVNLISPKGTYDGRFLQNYADIHITDALARIPGVAQINNFGLSKYAMRIWLDPARLTNLGLTGSDVRDAIQEQNQQVAAGAIGQAPAPAGQAFQYQLNTLGRLEQTSQFEDIIVLANPDGSVVHIRDVARVELGSEEYDWDTKLDGKPTATLIVFQLADANGLQIKTAVSETMGRLAKNFPQDMQWVMRYDTTEFITESIKEVIVTLLEAVALVVLVVFIFLQNFRAVLIPTIAVPVSLIGTFAFMKMFGFSVNSLSMLGMVLAVALVVDDAIVVVENVMRKLEEGGQRNMKEITAEAVNEVRGIIANKKDQGIGDFDLIPGQYAPVRLILGEDPATLLIPQPALLESQIGKQVFVVSQDNKVESRRVEVGRGYQGQWVIKKGLKKGDKVIVEGTQKVRPGVVVDAKPYSPKKDKKIQVSIPKSAKISAKGQVLDSRPKGWYLRLSKVWDKREER